MLFRSKIEIYQRHNKGMPCTLTPDQILELAPKSSYSVLVDPNVIAYFGDLLIYLSAAARRLVK
jgi:hypothetical protein